MPKRICLVWCCLRCARRGRRKPAHKQKERKQMRYKERASAMKHEKKANDE